MNIADGHTPRPLISGAFLRTLAAVGIGAALTVVICLPRIAQGQEMQPAQIIDASGFPEPMLAATAELPAGWRSQGGVAWNRGTNCVTNQVRIEWRARSRDDLQGFEIMPGYNWQVQGTQNQMNPCPTQRFRSTREFLEAVVQHRRAGARVLQYRDRPDIVSAVMAAKAGQPTNLQARTKVDSGQLLIAYTSDGIEFREVLGATVEFSEMQGNVVAGAPMVFALRAPNGQLDFALAERLANSFRYDKQWGVRMIATLRSNERRFSSGQSQAINNWHAKEMARINADGAADRAAIRSATSREVAAIRSATNAGTQATNDVIHRRTLEGIGEYNTYKDGSTTVKSSIHGGQRVLNTPNAGYVSTNDPYFNPAGSRELQRVR